MQRLPRLASVALGCFFAAGQACGDWTEFELVAGQNIVYVSEDATGPGTLYTWVPSNPDPNNDEITGTMEDVFNPTFTVDAYDNLADAYAAINNCTGQPAANCKPGWILLRRGDSWGAFPNLNKSGPTDEGWLLIGAYCDPDPNVPCDARPSVASMFMPCPPMPGTGTCNPANPPLHRIAIVSMEVRGATDTAIRFRRPVVTLHFEDLEIPEGELFGIEIGSLQAGTDSADVRIRRSVIWGRYHPTAGHSSGLLIANVNGLLVEECVLWHNGWNASIPNSATPENHNAYITCFNSDVSFVRNITADASATGWQQRPGGLADNNLSLRNPIGLLWGNNDPECTDAKYFASGLATNNVFIESRDITSNPSHWRAHGISIERTKPLPDGSTIKRNLIVKNTQGSGGTAAILVHDDSQDVLVAENVVYDWANAQAFAIYCKGGVKPNNIEVRANEFQRPNGGDLVHQQIKFDESGFSFTYEANKYYTTTSCWFRAEPEESCDHLSANECMSFSTWLTTSGESGTGASDQQVSYLDDSRDIESYLDCILGVTPGSDPITQFMLLAIQQSKTNWNPLLTAAAVNGYMRRGFNMELCPCDADFDSDQTVGVEDLLILLAAWGTCVNPSNCPEDLDGDGSVGTADLLILLAQWGPCDRGCDNCVGQSVVDPCVEHCMQHYEPGTRNFEACIEWCRDGAFGEFVPPEEE